MNTPLLLRCFSLAILLATGVPGRAELQTLTDKQNRSITADVLSVTGDQIRIRRDDGRTFDLNINNLAEADQQKLRDWAAKEAAKIPDGALRVELSRGVFETSKKESESTITTEEKWGYSVTASNTTNRPLSAIKFKYVLFVKPDAEPGKEAVASALKRSTGTHTIGSIESFGNTVFRTESIQIYKQKLKPGWIWGKTGNTEMIRDKLHGIWIKAYIGDQLVAEICNPESLAKTEQGP